MQTEYAQSFVTMMLGWIRSLSSGVASMFQTTGTGGASAGASMLAWFGAHWWQLLVALIAVGVVVDWIVWMLRWRPYWRWFGERQIVLDDDIDEPLSEAELARRYGLRADDTDRAPHFHSGALARRAAEPEDYESYVRGYDEDDEEEDEDDRDLRDEYDDAAEADEDDPFDIDDYALDDDDEFLSAVSEPPTFTSDQDTRAYQRPLVPAPDQDEDDDDEPDDAYDDGYDDAYDLDDEDEEDDEDAAPPPASLSRKARRRAREKIGHASL